jgi:hypothetical protein
MKMKANLPAKNPLAITVTTHAQREAVKAKYVPRPPKAGEFMLRLKRPQASPARAGEPCHEFETYAAGDIITAYGSGDQKLYVSGPAGYGTPGSLSGDTLPASCVTDAVWSLAVAALTDEAAKAPMCDALEAAGCPAAILAALRGGTKGIIGKIIAAPRRSYVVTSAKPGYTRAGEGWKEWEQLVTARLATQDDHDAVAAQKAAQEAETRRVMQASMDR